MVIDSIAVKGRISGHSILDTRLREVIDPDTYEVTHELIGTDAVLPGGVRLCVSRYNGQTWARIEHSMPNLLYGDNIRCTPLSEVFEQVGIWYEQSSGLVDWMDPVERLRVPRIDTPLEFDGVTDFDHLLDGLSRLRVNRSTVNVRYADGSAGDAQTLRRGVPRSWTVTAYAKGAEILSQARRERRPERRDYLFEQAARHRDRLRVEPSLRPRYLQPKGVVTMSDLNEHVLAYLRRGLFDRARLGVPVGGAPHLHAVLRQLPETDPANCKFWSTVVGTLMSEALGLPDPACDKIAQRNRRLARAWGISAADMTQVAGPAVVLDYESGSLRAAS